MDFSAISSDFSGAVADLFGGQADQAQARAADAQAAAARVGGQADRLKSTGDLVEGKAYGEAATLSDLNESYTEQSTAVQTAQADRALFGTLGAARADIAGSGGTEGGSAGDILRSSASQGALNRAVLGQQGLITEAGYKEQADSYRSLQTVAGLASQQDLLAAQGQDIAAQSYTDAAAADRKAAQGSDISAIIKGVAGFAQILSGNPSGVLDVFSAANNNTSLPSGSFDGSGAF